MHRWYNMYQLKGESSPLKGESGPFLLLLLLPLLQVR
jgi:hypothetical protein